VEAARTDSGAASIISTGSCSRLSPTWRNFHLGLLETSRFVTGPRLGHALASGHTPPGKALGGSSPPLTDSRPRRTGACSDHRQDVSVNLGASENTGERSVSGAACDTDRAGLRLRSASARTLRRPRWRWGRISLMPRRPVSLRKFFEHLWKWPWDLFFG